MVGALAPQAPMVATALIVTLFAFHPNNWSSVVFSYPCIWSSVVEFNLSNWSTAVFLYRFPFVASYRVPFVASSSSRVSVCASNATANVSYVSYLCSESSCELFSEAARKPASPYASSTTSSESAHRCITDSDTFSRRDNSPEKCASRSVDATRLLECVSQVECLRITRKPTLFCRDAISI